MKKLTLSCLLIAMSFIGANIKIMGTIAFDSLSAFVGTLLLGPCYGMAIAALGHMFTSMLAGFPLGIVIHIIVMCTMAITMFCYWVTYNFLQKRQISLISKYIITGLVGILVNGPISVAILVPVMGTKMILAIIIPLTIASALNIVLSLAIFHYVKDVWRKFL